MFSVLGGFVKRSVVIGLCYFFIVFRSLFFAKQSGEFAIKTKCFSTFLKSASSDFNEKTMPKHDFGRWILRPRSINFEGNPRRFSIVLFLRFVRFLKEQLNMMLLQESETVNKTLDVEQQIRF